MLVSAAVAVLATGLLMNIFERKEEARKPFVRLVEVGEDDTDPAKWGINWPRQYDSYRLTALATRTRFGGHGGSEALPEEKIERDPWLKRMFEGYAFSIDYRDRRGHAYMLDDQEMTKRLTKPQTGSCLHCHASIMPVYRKLGDGDAQAGFEKTYEMSYQDLSKIVHDMGHAHPVSCVDCHDPATMALRVTRPGFINAIQVLATSECLAPASSFGRALAEDGSDETLRPQWPRLTHGDAVVRLRAMPCRVLLLEQVALGVSLEQGTASGADRRALERTQISRRRTIL